ncbi:MAG: system killer suppression protein [Ignavibacteriae bacterium]|nr:system killer suppression protein [Ignavibacteriota bacterium]
MDITFRNEKLAKIFNSEKSLMREYGTENAKKIKHRMAVLAVATCLDEVPVHPPDRRHELSGDRKGQFAVDLKHPQRLIFEPNHNPLPRRTDGGLDLRKISAITIVEVEDYHG